jgi:galactose mutarotase-like enzyme
MHAVADTTYEGFPAVELSSAEDVSVTYAPGVGMVGCSLRHGGEELLAQRGGLARYRSAGSTFGIPLLHPWANRLSGFSCDLAGRHVDLDADSPLVRLDQNGLPIHGLVNASPYWSVDGMAADDRAARLSATLDFAARPEYLALFPFPHELRMDVDLARSTLTVRTTLRPTGDAPVPVSFGYHPYLTLPGVPRADWVVELPVGRHLKLDRHSIPTGETEPATEPRAPLADRDFDDGYTGLEAPPVFTLEGGGRRIEVQFGDGYPFAQVYAPPEDALICFEPMTAPTNALVSRWALPMVEPGASFSTEFALRVKRV